jgi:hypothetical protein
MVKVKAMFEVRRREETSERASVLQWDCKGRSLARERSQRVAPVKSCSLVCVPWIVLLHSSGRRMKQNSVSAGDSSRCTPQALQGGGHWPCLSSNPAVRPCFVRSCVGAGFQVGDVITVINRDNEGWWEGELNGQRGLFPWSVTRQRRPAVAPLVPLMYAAESRKG